MVKTLGWLCTAAAITFSVGAAQADTIKVGVIGTMSGPYALFGKNYKMGIDAWVAEHGNKVAGHTVEFVYRDEVSPNPAQSKALAQELIVKEKVQYLAGLYFTPNAMAVAPLLQEAKVPMVVLNAATSSITEKSPYIVRTSFTMFQNTVPAAKVAKQKGANILIDKSQNTNYRTSTFLWFDPAYDDITEAVLKKLNAGHEAEAAAGTEAAKKAAAALQSPRATASPAPTGGISLPPPPKLP